MKLLAVTRSTSPDDPRFIRVSADMRSAAGERFPLFFEVPGALEGSISHSGNAWVVAMLPYAIHTGEPIECELPVDAQLLENLKGLVAVWKGWFPELRAPELHVPTATVAQSTANRPDKTAVFFSGGVDSWFSALRHMPDLEPAAVGSIDDLLAVHGFDIPYESHGEFARLHAMLVRAAQELRRELVVVRTNLKRKGTPWQLRWGELTHGAGLAAVAMILEGRYRKVLVASTHPYGGLIPWGSHPMTDALLCTSTLTLKHDGASFDRVEKTALIARHRVALENLHVCFTHGNASNCGRCAKCMRTLTTLHLLGALEIANPFPVKFDVAKLANVFVRDENEQEFFKEMLELAKRRGRDDVRVALERAIRRSSRWRPFVPFTRRFQKTPLLWRLGPR